MATTAAANRAYACPYNIHVYRGHVKTKEMHSAKGEKKSAKIVHNQRKLMKFVSSIHQPNQQNCSTLENEFVAGNKFCG